MRGSGDEKPDLAFTDGRAATFLKVIDTTGLRDRNALLQAALGSVSCTRIANRVYLVLPKVHAAVMDAAILREKGLGLIVYDSKGVEEVLPPRFFDHDTADKEPSPDLELLKRRISDLERTVESLTTELSKVKSLRLEQLETRKTRPESSAVAEPQRPERLPSFLEDNPWLDILSRRGSEPEKIAG